LCCRITQCLRPRDNRLTDRIPSCTSSFEVRLTEPELFSPFKALGLLHCSISRDTCTSDTCDGRQSSEAASTCQSTSNSRHETGDTGTDRTHDRRDSRSNSRKDRHCILLIPVMIISLKQKISMF